MRSAMRRVYLACAVGGICFALWGCDQSASENNTTASVAPAPKAGGPPVAKPADKTVAHSRPPTAYRLVVALTGSGTYQALLNGAGLTVEKRVGDVNVVTIPVPQTSADREMNEIVFGRLYATDEGKQRARAELSLPSYGFLTPPRARRPLRLGELTAVGCEAEGKQTRYKSEEAAVRGAIIWENVFEACEGLENRESTLVYALEHALYSRKWLVQNYPEDYAASDKLLERATEVLNTARRCVASKSCGGLATEIRGTRYLGYKLYQPLTKLTDAGLYLLDDKQLKAAAGALVMAETAYAACTKEAQYTYCSPANFPQLRLDICGEIKRRALPGIATCPLPTASRGPGVSGVAGALKSEE